MTSEVLGQPTERNLQQSQWLPITVTGIQNSDPPRLEFYSIMTLQNGAKKHCQSTAMIEDEALLQRLRAEMELGNKFRIYIRTDWGAAGIPVVLLDFCRI
jgi:hypothetical protein